MKAKIDKVFFWLMFSFGFLFHNAMGQFTVSGSHLCDGNYSTLTNSTGVFFTLNAQDQVGHNIVITVTDNSISELGTYTITGAAGMWASLKINPDNTGNSYTISGTVDSVLISLDGADYVTFDGSQNGSGTGAIKLTISNLSTGAKASSFKFINDAVSNTIKYCTVTGSTLNTSGGVIFFSIRATGAGNDNNIIDNCNLTKAGLNSPINLIYSDGGNAPNQNSSNTISNCNFYDYNGSTNDQAAIKLATSNTDWTISGNSIYQTTNYAGTTGSKIFGIYLNTSGNNYVIKNNYIGGSGSACSGTWTVNGLATTYKFVGMYLDLNNGTNTIEGNTIKGFNWLTTSAAGGIPGNWCGIYTLSNTSATIGSFGKGNTIGDGAIGSISMTCNESGGAIFGIAIGSSGTISAQYNTIGSMSGSTSTNSKALSIYGICKTSGTGATTISNNTIGSSTVANSIITNAISTATSTAQFVYGIYNSTSSPLVISNNIIANLTSMNTVSSSLLSGILHSGSSDATISGNTIHDLKTFSASTNVSSGILAGQGIAITGSSASYISQNTIYQIIGSGTYATHIAGISEASPNSFIDRNKIYGITNTSTSAGKTANGIVLTSLNSGYCANNMISLGANDATEYRGIWVATADAASTKKIYFNSVYIGGTASGGSSYAFLRSNVDAPLYMRNNIFSNFRTGGAGKHYAIGSQNTTWTSTYTKSNAFYSATLATTALWGAADNSYDAWIANSGVDAQLLSTNIMPVFVDAPNCDLHLTPANACAFNGLGEVIAGITLDIDEQTRNTTHPDLGADEFTPTLQTGSYVWRGWASTDWSTNSNWQCEFAPINITAETVTIPDMPTDPLTTADVSLTDLDILSGAILSIGAAKELKSAGTINLLGTLILKSNATGTGSLMEHTINQTGAGIVERYFEGNQYHYISSPLSTVTAGSVASSDHYYSYNEQNADIALKTDWLKGWEKTAATDLLVKSKGYALFYGKTATFSFSGGTLNSGDQSILIYNSASRSSLAPKNPDGWNLVGNPYPSPINADAFIDANVGAIDGSLYLWTYNGNSGWDPTGSDYACYTKAGGVNYGTTNETVKPVIGANSLKIAQTQGFFVHKLATGSNTLVFNNTMRVSANAHFFKGERNIQRMYLNITNKDSLYNQTLLAFTEEATMNFDNGYDAIKLRGNTKLALFSMQDYKECTIQAQPLLTDIDRVIPIGLETKVSGDFTFNLESLEKIDPFLNIYLIDKEKNTTTDLRQENSYNFSMKSGLSQNRFQIVFTINNLIQMPSLLVESIKIYANDKQVIVELPASAKSGGTVRIFDLFGREEVNQVFADEYLLSIPTHVKGGIYVVEVRYANQVKVGKIFINQ